MSSEFRLLPTNRVVSAVKTQEEIDVVKSALLEAGFDEEKIVTAHGEEGKDFVDPDGSRHGFLAHLTRQFQRTSGPEADLLDQAEEALDAGHYLISVLTDGSELEQVQARNAMSPHTHYAIFYCGKLTIYVLEHRKIDG